MTRRLPRFHHSAHELTIAAMRLAELQEHARTVPVGTVLEAGILRRALLGRWAGTWRVADAVPVAITDDEDTAPYTVD